MYVDLDATSVSTLIVANVLECRFAGSDERTMDVGLESGATGMIE